ncbi:metal-dependent transcriptional regulator [Fodinisporobacter ferrooxydans]|uniref:Metal-dependent transcriptional regulator n=1 Tax=Fodinisporobacter ferrooxydans TaxID=2901836 RepID=A0ABY4CMJ9_9BACL|nr:metal-dependent transcriptional regulator [Alicyclobacillaceae bacterium MYW30-H2]
MFILANHSLDEYVGTVWRLTQYGGTATTSEVASKLGVTSATTSHMFKKMADVGLVEYKEYSGVILTPEGKIAAMRYIRRHRIAERFLVEILGIPWDRADELSDQMEHSLPDEVIDRMEEVMGFPASCPHGYPIPTRDGYLPEIEVKRLSELKIGDIAVIAWVYENDPKLLQYFKQHGIVPGETIEVLDRDEVGYTSSIRVNQSKIVLGSQIEELVSVKI